MKLIIGLGNPGLKYETTRHNVGFLALEHHLKDVQAISCQSSFESQICEIHFGTNKVFFIKPQTFMNNSGRAVREVSNFYKLSPADILVIHDEVDLPFGTIRTNKGSGAAGHNGIQNIIDELGTQDFSRVRIGVESRASRSELPTDVFVLSPFTPEQINRLNKEILPKVSQEIVQFLQT